MFKWLTRKQQRSTAAKPQLRLEGLEVREVPAVLIQLDYSRDLTGFFNNPEARAIMERAASEFGNSLNANLAAIVPHGGNTWTATFFDPATGGQTGVANLSVGANTLRIFVGGRAMSRSEAGFGGYGGTSISGSQAWLNAVETRGHSGFSPWGGSIAFDTNQRWHFGQTTDGLDSTELDFYSVAVHELGHVLGIGTAPEWMSLASGGYFYGANASAVYGGAVPLNPNASHWADGVIAGGQGASLDPTLTYGTRVTWSALDAAALRDLGWGASGPVAATTGADLPAAAAAPALNARQPFAFTGHADGLVSTFVMSGG
ncbi:MAG: matrixin family metalloprotease, partial [Gemmata sp.]